MGVLRQRLLKLTLSLQNARHSFIAHRQVALPVAVIRIASGQLFADREAFDVLRQRLLTLALHLQNARHPFIAHRQVALPVAVIRVARSQLLRKHVSDLVGIQGLIQLT